MEAMMLDRIVEVFCEVDDFCQAFVPQWEASLLGTGGPAPRGPQPGLSISEIITLLLTVQVSNISRASITASPSRWLLSRHAVLRTLRHPAEKRLRAAGVLPAQSPGDRALLHRFHRPCDNHRRLLLGCGVMGSGLRRPAPRSRSRAKPFRVCGYCERTGRSRDKAAASPAKYRDAARIAEATRSLPWC